jgi:hypothetical protein
VGAHADRAATTGLIIYFILRPKKGVGLQKVFW